MALTYDSITTSTLGTNSATISLTSIPATYTDLILVLNIVSPGGSVYTPNLRFNSDTATNYSTTGMYGQGSSAGATSSTNATSMTLGNLVGNLGSTSPFIVQINNYADTNLYKSVLSRGQNTNSAGGDVSAICGTWRQTAAISSITLGLNGGNYATGTMVTLYGIKAA